MSIKMTITAADQARRVEAVRQIRHSKRATAKACGLYLADPTAST